MTTTPTTPNALGIKVVQAYRDERTLPEFRATQTMRDRQADYRDYNAKPKLYISHQNANGEAETLLENLFLRHDRPISLYRKVIKQILQAAGLDPKQIKAHWSQKAGCSCGCSPAYLLQNIPRGEWNFDIWVTIQPTNDGLGTIADDAWLDEAATKVHFAEIMTKNEKAQVARKAELQAGACI